MKNIYRTSILLFVFCISMISCSSDDNTDDTIDLANAEIVTLTFTHYRTLSFQELLTTPILLPVSIENGNTSMNAYYRFVEGFDYDPGFDYELRVAKSAVENPLQDASSIRYQLLEVVSKIEGSTIESFDVFLGSTIGNVTEYYTTEDPIFGFQLSNTIPINCGGMCDAMLETIPDGNTFLFGTFTRNTDNSYTLINTFFD